MRNIELKGPHTDMIEGILQDSPEERARVWVGSRQHDVEMRAVGLWLDLSTGAAAAQGVWAGDPDHALEVARQRGWAPERRELRQLLAHWPWETPPADLPVRAVDSPLGGVFLLPDPDQSRPARTARSLLEFRWLPVRPSKKPPHGGR